MASHTHGRGDRDPRPKLDTADEWYVANKDGFRGALTTAQITEEHILEYPR